MHFCNIFLLLRFGQICQKYLLGVRWGWKFNRDFGMIYTEKKYHKEKYQSMFVREENYPQVLTVLFFINLVIWLAIYILQ